MDQMALFLLPKNYGEKYDSAQKSAIPHGNAWGCTFLSKKMIHGKIFISKIIKLIF